MLDSKPTMVSVLFSPYPFGHKTASFDCCGGPLNSFEICGVIVVVNASLPSLAAMLLATPVLDHSRT
jgi:hypothetical protein